MAAEIVCMYELGRPFSQRVDCDPEADRLRCPTYNACACAL
jgi:hypothetical protein